MAINSEYVIERALNGDEMSTEEAEGLLQLSDDRTLEHLRSAADTLRKNLVGDVVTFVRNRNINFTNICNIDCAFCNFAKHKEDSSSFSMNVPGVIRKIEDAVPYGIREVCLQGGINPEWYLNDYVKLVSTIKERFPWIHIHAFSPFELFYMAKKSRMTVTTVIKTLVNHGLGSIPGTAAEILDDEVREIICRGKLKTQEWIEVVESAHQLGVKSSATIMFGHIETLRHRARHLFLLRELQKHTGGFSEFIPLPFVPFKTKLARSHEVTPISNIEVFKFYAVSRLFLGKWIPNIQTSWVKLGKEAGGQSLHWGINDFGGTVIEENISRSAGADHGQFLTAEEIQHIIEGEDRIPRERDTLYHMV